MKNLGQKLSRFNAVPGTAREQRTENLLVGYFIEEKSSILNMMAYLTALLLTLPVITTLLLLWFRVK